MTEPSSHRNLFFGILALQIGLISREQLVAAAKAWANDKSRWLEDVLLEQRALDAEACRLLRGLVDKHFESQSEPLAADAISTLASSVRADLQALNDAEIAATLADLEGDTRGGDEGSRRSRRGGEVRDRFRILRPHARGGLGEVYVATDEELNREVALKEIRPDAANSPDFRSRFVMEAEITGRLEHPGIVPVYGLGAHADGRPYYAMRFIRGESLEQAVNEFHRQSFRDAAERSVAFRQLLGRFIDICHAVQYAHSRGVLHRDLKPGNVMLGKYGETLVVDWGLAKVIGSRSSTVTVADSAEETLRPISGSDVSPTRMGATLGTPGYMSPEQADGMLDQLGPASDVYSLGATLYYVLTGKAAFRKSADAEIRRRVQAGEFPRPTAVASDTPQPLESICLKAMALSPDDRYPSPELLAAEVERWLADEPVAAHPENAVSRAARWLRRRRAWLAPAAIALVLVAAVSAAAALLINAQRQIAVRLAQQNQELAAKEAESRVESEQLAADNQTKFEQVRELAKTFLFEIDPKISTLVGSASARQFVVETGLKYLDALAQSDAPDEQMKWDLVVGYQKMGDVLGNVQTSNLGDTEGALAAYLKAKAICEELLAADDENPKALEQMAAILDREGMIWQTLGKNDQALPLYQKSLALAEKATPEGAAPSLSTWVATNRVGDLLYREGEIDQALDHHQRALVMIERLARDNAESLQVLRLRTINLLLIAKDQRRLEQYDAALATLLRDEKLIGELREQHPTNALFRRDEAFVLDELSETYSKLERYDEALQVSERSVAAYEALQVDPEDTRSRRDVARAYQGHGKRLMDAKRYEEALKLYRKSLKQHTDLFQEDPTNDFNMRDVGISHNKVGEALEEVGRLDEALESYRESLRSHQQSLAASDNPTYRSSIAIEHQNIGIIHRKQGEFAQARAAFDECVTIREKLVEDHPSDVTAKSELAYILRTRAWLLAVCRDDSVRDGAQAQADAARAGELDPDQTIWFCRVQAAANAEAGDFNAAKFWLANARKLTVADGDDALLEELEADQKRLESDQPLRKALRVEQDE